MTWETKLFNGFNYLIGEGKTVSVKIFSGSIAAGSGVYDDDVSYSLNSTTWTSGMVFPIGNSKGSSDPILLEQGKLLMSDSKLYLGSSINLSGLGITLGIGSPATQTYSIVPEGIIKYTLGDNTIYQRLYIRNLAGGSLF